MLMDFKEKEREEEREEEKRQRERETSHWLAASPTHPDQGSNPQPQHVPWLGIQPVSF